MLKELQQTQLNESIDIYTIDAPLGDKFLPTRKLGAGAYGVVIEARDLESGNIVALKILDSEKCDAQEVLLEAQCLQRLRGAKNIPQFHGLYQFSDCIAISTQALGSSMKAQLEKYGKLNSRQALKLGIEMIAALKEMHDRNMVHQDIKPANILFGREPEDSQTYLIDFGISQVSAQPLSQQTRSMVPNFKGTLPFAAIDAHMGLQLGKKDDLESLIYTLIYLRTGSISWVENLQNRSDPTELNHEILERKMNCDPADLFRDTPSCLMTAYEYIRQLKFCEDPDYTYLTNLLQTGLDEESHDKDSESEQESLESTMDMKDRQADIFELAEYNDMDATVC